MEDKNNLEKEPKTNENIHSSKGSTEETDTPKEQGSTQTTKIADPPPTTSPEGAGEVIKPIERRERNPKKR